MELPVNIRGILRSALVLGLLLIIISRMVWVQERDFKPHINQQITTSHVCSGVGDKFLSGSEYFSNIKTYFYNAVCVSDSLRANQAFVLMVFFIGGLLVRLISGSWILALISIAISISGSRPLYLIEVNGAYNAFLFLTMCWFFSMCLYIRTPHIFYLIVNAFLSILMAHLGIPFFVLANFGSVAFMMAGHLVNKAFVKPFSLRRAHAGINKTSILKKNSNSISAAQNIFQFIFMIPSSQTKCDYLSTPKSIFSCVNSAFRIWVFRKKRSFLLVSQILIFTTLGMVFLVVNSDMTINLKFDSFFLDLQGILVALKHSFSTYAHNKYILCLTPVLLTVVLAPYDIHRSYYEVCWGFLAYIIGGVLVYFLLDIQTPLELGIDFTQLILFFEPIVYALGVMGYGYLFHYILYKLSSFRKSAVTSSIKG